MISLGQNATEQKAFRNALTNPYAMRIRVQSTNLEGQFDADLTDMVMDGQVDVDADADVTRSLSLSLLDENRTLSFDSKSPSQAALFMDRMIRVWYGVRVDFGWNNPNRGLEWVDVPVFTGPITGLSRSGDTVSVEAQGKELLAMGACWAPINVKKGQLKVIAIRRIMRERAGERHFELPALQAKLPNPLSMGRQGIPWNRCRNIATGMGGRQLFYDGRGALRLRLYPANPNITLTGLSMLSALEITHTQGEVVNCVFVKGGVPKGKKDRLTAEVFPARDHPLSPWRLGRNGVPRYLMDVIEDNSIRNAAEARRVGVERLQRGLAQAVDARVDILPMPHLEPGDMIQLTDPTGAVVNIRMRQFTIPLTAGQPETVGYTRNVSPRKRKGTISGPRYTVRVLR